MASSSSSSQTIPTHHHNHNHLLHLYGGPTAAPPPTPSTQSTTSTATSATTVDTLTRLLHRLPPSLSLPTRLSPRATTAATTAAHLPTITSLSSPASDPAFSSAATGLGYFQLSPLDHRVTHQLAESAESDSLSLLKHKNFPREVCSPFGHDHENDDDHDNDEYTTEFCVTTTTELSPSLAELATALEEVGLRVVEKLASSMGFENPFEENGSNSSLMWVSLNEGEKLGRAVYPYVVGLEYQIRVQKWSLVTDLGSVCVEPEVGSVLVTFGDIAQVWSNGRVKKVRGKPTPILEDTTKQGCSPHCISMTLLLTLPLETMVSPLALNPTMTSASEMEVLKLEKCRKDDDEHGRGVDPNNNNDCGENDEEDARVFNSFSFEDYAWRVYHDRLQLKDPLDRYRRLCN